MAKKTVKKAKKSVPKKKTSAVSKSVVRAPVQPLADRVLVRRMEMPDKKSASGIILPDSAQKEKSKMGMVLAVGPGRVNDRGDIVAMTVSVGDTIVFNSGWDNEVSMDDDHDYFLVRESEVMAILNK